MTTTSKDNIPLAVTVIIITVLALSLGDALIKFTSGELVIWQIFVVRSLLAVPILLLILKFKSPNDLAVPSGFGWVVLRSMMLVAMWIAYYMALPNLDLSIAAAAYYTLPIFITLFSSLFIGDSVSIPGWGAVFIGFIGVLLILQPEAGKFNHYVLLPLISAVLYALAMILTRTKCRTVNPLMLSIMLNTSFITVGGLASLVVLFISPGANEGYLLTSWVPMGSNEWLTMVLLAAAILIGSVGAAIAYQKGPPSIVGTFDFAYVGFAVLWGILFFQEIPDLVSVFGIALIVAAGVMSMRQ